MVMHGDGVEFSIGESIVRRAKIVEIESVPVWTLKQILLIRYYFGFAFMFVCNNGSNNC